MNQFLKIWSKSERTVAVVCFGLMAALMIVDVLSRELGFEVPVGFQKSALYLMIWGAFLGISMASQEGTHLRPDSVTKLWPARFHSLLSRLSDAVTALFCLFLAYQGWVYVLVSWEMGDLDVILDIPLWLIQGIIPYALLSMALRHSIYAVAPGLKPSQVLSGATT